MVYPALLPLILTPQLPVVDWTDAPADLNGLVRFAERRILVSAHVPSHFKCILAVTAWQIPDAVDTVLCPRWLVGNPPETCRAVHRNKNCVTSHLVGHTLEYIWDARNSKRKICFISLRACYISDSWCGRNLHQGPMFSFLSLYALSCVKVTGLPPSTLHIVITRKTTV